MLSDRGAMEIANWNNVSFSTNGNCDGEDIQAAVRRA